MIENIEGLPPLHRFEHAAMHTTFEIWISGEEAHYARSTAMEVFREIDLLETKLSRFVENSDITRINQMSGQAAVRIGLEAMECLRVAVNVSAVTGGAFDVTVGALMSLWKPDGGSPREPAASLLEAARTRTGMRLLELDEENIAAGLSVAGAEIDLGAIGKGYALDYAARMLREWGIPNATIHGGGSSFYAMGAPEGCPGWPLGVGYGADSTAEGDRRVVLSDMALSASGTEMQGSHILDPRTGRPPVDRCIRAWAINPSATVSDALSTAFMVLSEEDVAAVCGQFNDVGALLLLEREGRHVLRRLGAWPGGDAKSSS